MTAIAYDATITFMTIYTIGYAKKTAKTFFETLKVNRIDTLIDVRLYNSSQLAGFCKGRDLEYFLAQICGCEYIWAVQFAPSAELLGGYKDGKITWSQYEENYDKLIAARGELDFFGNFHGKRVCLLCAEATAEHCHRRLLAERVAETFEGVVVVHL